jgi:hypothetical protein
MSEPATHHGACLCGATHYNVSGSLDQVDLCHCSQCRRANGGAFNVAVIVDSAQVIFGSRDAIREYSGSPGKYRAFCGTCGSPIYSRRDDLPEKMRLRGGTIADLPEPANLRHIYFTSRWPWIDRLFNAPTCEEM